MCAVRLRVDVPDHGLARPLRTHERVLATHEVPVAGPEQVVVVELAQIGQGVDAQVRARDQLVAQRARAGQQQGRLISEQARQRFGRRARVAEQADEALARAATQALACQPSLGIEVGLARLQVHLPQQAASTGAEAGVEEVFDQPSPRAAELRGRQAVAALDVVLRAQILKVDPARRRRQLRHAGNELGRQLTAKGLDHDLAGRDALQLRRCGPCAQLDAGMTLGRHPGECRCVVHPKPHMDTARGQVAAQAPANTQVAMVVDDAAEDVPVLGQGGRGYGHGLTLSGDTMRPHGRA